MATHTSINQEIYRPDQDVARVKCCICESVDIIEERIELEDGFDVYKFWCDNCEDYVAVIEL